MFEFLEFPITMADGVLRAPALTTQRNANQNRYTKKQEQRRKLDALLSSPENSNLVQRRNPTEEELSNLLKSLKENKIADFGLVKLSALNLDCLCGTDGQLQTLLQHAVLMKRDKIAMALLRAGASVSIANHHIIKYPMQYVVWLLRYQLSRPQKAICHSCGDSGVLCVYFSECGHSACFTCFWENINNLDTMSTTASSSLVKSEDCMWDNILEPIVCCVVCGSHHKQNICSTKDSGMNMKLLRLSPEECKSSSYAKWCELPSDAQHPPHKQKVPSSTRERADAAMHLSEVVQVGLGNTQSQRHDEFRKAIAKGDVRRVAALIEAGVHMDGVDEYGMTALMLAVWLKHTKICRLLLDAGADSTKRDALSNSAWNIAVDKNCDDIVRLLTERCPDNDNTEDNSVRHFHNQILVDHSKQPPVVTTLIPRFNCNNKFSVDFWSKGLGVKGAEDGAFHIDAIFTETFLSNLIDVHSRLTVAPSEKPKCASRSYFCDVSGGIVALLEQAIRIASGPIGSNVQVRVFPQMRFLHYTKDGSALAPHVDLSHRDVRDLSIKSTHTLILYLTDCSSGGGETVLLRSLCKKLGNDLKECSEGTGDCHDNVIASVSPKMGRLLIFPHFCPHEGRAICSKEPKLLLRGEVFLAFN